MNYRRDLSFALLGSRFPLRQGYGGARHSAKREGGSVRVQVRFRFRVRGSANFAVADFVETVVFGPRYRRPPFTDPLNWTDYRWETGPWGHRAAARGPWASCRRHRGDPFLLLLAAGLAAMVGAKLLSSLNSRNGSWTRRGLYAVLLLMIVGAFSRNRRSRWW